MDKWKDIKLKLSPDFVIELWKSERRLAVDNGFNSVIQEILHAENTIFT